MKQNNHIQTEMRVKSAFEKATPDVLDSILAGCHHTKGRILTMTKEKKFSKFTKAAIAFAACFVMVVGCVAGYAAFLPSLKASTSAPPDKNSSITNEAVNNWVPLSTEAETIAVMGLHGWQEYYDGCIYYRGAYSYLDAKTGKESQYYTLLCYDMKTGIVSSACKKPACTHSDKNCPLYFSDTTIVAFRVIENNVYYLTASYKPDKIDTSIKGGLHSLDLKTMQYKYLCDWNACETSGISYHNDKLYYVQCDWHEDGGYDQYIWSFDLKTGKNEKLLMFGDENDDFLHGRSTSFIDEQGRMIFLHLPSDYDILNFTSKQTIIFERAELKKDATPEKIAEFDAKFNVFSYETLRYHDGKILFQEPTELINIELNKNAVNLYNFSVKYVDTETGDLKTLLENTVQGYDIAGDYMYYRPFVPEVLTHTDGYQTVSQSQGKFAQLNMKTGEIKEYKMDNNLELLSGNFSYVGGRLFGYMRDYTNPETGILPIEYDIATGEYRETPETVVNPALGYSKN